MIDAGALEEVRTLLARRLDPDLSVMRAIGVPELIAHLQDGVPLDAAVAAAKQATRNYAKRQLTWFRGQPPAHWPRCADEASVAKVMKVRPGLSSYCL